MTRQRALPAMLAGLLSVLGGRALTPPPLPPAAIDAPAAWSDSAGPDTGNADTLGAAWWSGFADALLTDLVAQALQSNSRIDGARAALLQARSVHRAAPAGRPRHHARDRTVARRG